MASWMSVVDHYCDLNRIDALYVTQMNKELCLKRLVYQRHNVHTVTHYRPNVVSVYSLLVEFFFLV